MSKSPSMSMRMTDILGYLTLFAILGAIWVLFGEDPSKEQGGRGEIYLADFASKTNSVSKIDLAGQGGVALSFVKKDAGWVLAGDDNTAGYGVVADHISGTLQALATATRVEPKTMNKDRFPNLNLGDKATVITLYDAKGEQIRSLRMGKHRMNRGKSRSYAYQNSDTRAWMVSGLPTFSLEVKDWIVNPVINIQRKDVKSMTLSDGTVISNVDGKLAVTGLKDGEKAVSEYLLGETMNAVAQLSAETVLKLSNPLTSPLAKVALLKNDGSSVQIAVHEVGSDQWVQVAGLPSLNGWMFKLSDRNLAALLKARSDLIEMTAKK